MGPETLILQARKRLSCCSSSEILVKILSLLEHSIFEDVDIQLLIGRNPYKSLLFPSIELAFLVCLLSVCEAGSNLIVPEYLDKSLNDLLVRELQKFQINVKYYSDSGEIPKLIDDNTKLIIVDFPSSITYKMENIENTISIAKQNNILTIAHNSIVMPFYFKPLEYGFDLSLYKLSDIGVLSIANSDLYESIFNTYKNFNINPPKKCKLHEKLHLFPSIFKQKQESAIKINDWLKSLVSVERIFFLADAESKNYGLWKKYCNGNASLITVVLKKKYHEKSINNMFKHLRVFAVSEKFNDEFSNIFEIKDFLNKTAFRISCGLEGVDVLIQDLKRAFERLVTTEKIHEIS